MPVEVGTAAVDVEVESTEDVSVESPATRVLVETAAVDVEVASAEDVSIESRATKAG